MPENEVEMAEEAAVTKEKAPAKAKPKGGK